MLQQFFTILFILVGIYLLLGFIFAFYFILKGMFQLDENTKNSPWTFRLIIIPGLMVFWIFFLKKLWRKN